ncbi:uncharacterized protein [Apostichopus japonicus]|uniref:uncharacterized protein isoform X5 n=1 Tax=Stichopus japonicus TaxID=307972 RepID=UPI003AB756BF
MKIPFLSFKMDTRRSLCLAFLLSFTAVVVRCETTSTTELPLTATDHSTDFTTILTTEILTIENEALSTEGSTVPPLSTVKPSSVPPVVGDCGGAVCGENEECTGGESPVCDCKEGYQRNAETSICEVGDCGGAVCGENEECTGGESPVCDCVEGYQRNETTSICEVVGDCGGAVCVENEKCTEGDNPVCDCKEGYQRNAETSICEVVGDCGGAVCGDNEECIEGDNPVCNCVEGYQRNAETSICEVVGNCGGAVCGENEECTGGESPVCDCMEGYQRNETTNICEVGNCGGAVCGENEECTGGESPVCDCMEGYQRNETTNICEVVGNCGGAVCGENEECTEGDNPVCNCVEGYQRNAETSICEVTTCSNHQCGEHGICKGNDTTFLGCECDNFSRLKNGFCEELSCDTTLLCHGPGDECIDHMLGYMCICNETLNRVNNPDQSDCIARTCNNSCTATNQICSDEGGYNCTCQDGYTKISDDVPCQEIILPTTATTEVTPSLGDGSTKGPETPVITAAPPTPGPGSTQKQPPQSTKAPPQGPGSTQDLTPKKPPTTPAPKAYTGAIVGLFIFLVATCLVFVAIYLVRRRKLRNNYGRLDEDSEGDGGWSAFSKNPIYRGDKDYQPL